MQRSTVVLLSALLASLGFALPAQADAIRGGSGQEHRAQAADEPSVPDVVVIMSDDQRQDTLAHMPAVKRQLRARGTQFMHTIVPTATCCPSRASFLTGLFAHDTGVYGNSNPDGGWQTFFDRGNEDRTLAVALHARGYRTALFGKYLNGFATNPAGVAAGHVPPGWDEFVTFADTTAAYYNYRLTDGTTHGHRARDYSTDVLRRKAVRFIRDTPDRQPLFLMLTPKGPHGPATPAPRHVGDLTGKLRSYHPPSVTEDVGDKPPWLRDNDRQPQRDIDEFRQSQMEALLSVDDAVDSLVGALRRSGRLDNTLLVFTSDNGLMWGDHRARGKNLPYRFATDVPLILRWDGHISAGARDARLALNLDITATIADTTGADMLTSGRSLTGDSRRSQLLLEARPHQRDDGGEPHPGYCGLRTRRYLFVHYTNGFEELYDYPHDPYETRNRAGSGAYTHTLALLREATETLCLPVPPGFSWTP